MRIIDDVFDAYINSTIGPCQSLRRFVAHQAYLNERGYQLTLFTRDFVINGAPNSEPVDFSKGLDFRSRLKQLFKKSKVASILFQIREKKEAEKLVKAYLAENRNPDVVVFRSLYEANYYMRHRKDTKAKVVLFHQDDGIRLKMLLESYPKLKGTFWEKMIRKQSVKLDRIVDRNTFIAFRSRDNFAEENPDIPKEKLVAFHNGIDDSPCIKGEKITPYKYNLCTSGTVCARKGQYLIVDALLKISEESRKKIHVTVIGTGNDLELLKDKVKQNKIEENVTFLGNVPNKEVHGILCASDIYILMSNSEGLPISIIEGLRAGLGVISTPVAGIPELVDDKNGVLINPDSDELANVFEHIDSYDWKEYGINSRQRFEEEYDFSRMISSYCDMMDDLLKES